MKTSHRFFLPLLVTTGSVVESFVLVDPHASVHHPVTQLMAETTHGDKLAIEEAQHQWQDDIALLHAVEHAVETDPDLMGLVAPEKSHMKKASIQHVVEQQGHVHDSLLAEIQHALEHDPDLVNIVENTKKARSTSSDDMDNIINRDFMERGAHVHDSLLNEVCHALDMDPDLSK
jgi:hypothetical protein